jgi:HK97 gp10 family phage protein
MARKVSVGQVNVRGIASLTGDKELETRLKGIAPRMQERVFKRAVKPALERMMKSAKANVLALSVQEPTNTVRKSIASRIMVRVKGRMGSRYKTIGRLAVFYGQSARQRPKQLRGAKLQATLAHLLEFGFRLTHVFGLKVRPRKIEAKPFMRPAFESNRSQAEATFVSVVKQQIEAEGVA